MNKETMKKQLQNISNDLTRSADLWKGEVFSREHANALRELAQYIDEVEEAL